MYRMNEESQVMEMDGLACGDILLLTTLWDKANLTPTRFEELVEASTRIRQGIANALITGADGTEKKLINLSIFGLLSGLEAEGDGDPNFAEGEPCDCDDYCPDDRPDEELSEQAYDLGEDGFYHAPMPLELDWDEGEDGDYDDSYDAYLADEDQNRRDWLADQGPTR